MFLAALIATALAADVVPASKTTVPAEPPTMNAPASSEGAEAGAVKTPRVVFIEPKDGATVPPKFTVKFAVEGMKVEADGKSTMGSGHHHLIIDGAAVPKGQHVPMDASHLHFAKGQGETQITLKPGAHSLTLQFADGHHLSYGEMMSQTIHVTVK